MKTADELYAEAEQAQQRALEAARRIGLLDRSENSAEAHMLGWTAAFVFASLNGMLKEEYQ